MHSLWRIFTIGLFLGVFSCAIAKAPLIVLDAGHGGKNIGARGQSPYCEEKKVCLITALLTKQHLQKLGYRVSLTRKSDVFLSLKRRVNIAKKLRAAAFISLHYNACADRKVRGIEVFYFNGKNRRSQRSFSLAKNVLTKLVRRTKAKSRGVKKGSFYVIRHTTMPAILVEGGFISNPQERKKLRSRSYINQIAKAIAEGIHSYMKTK